jgi:hypothetical protein
MGSLGYFLNLFVVVSMALSIIEMTCRCLANNLITNVADGAFSGLGYAIASFTMFVAHHDRDAD